MAKQLCGYGVLPSLHAYTVAWPTLWGYVVMWPALQVYASTVCSWLFSYTSFHIPLCRSTCLSDPFCGSTGTQFLHRNMILCSPLYGSMWLCSQLSGSMLILNHPHSASLCLLHGYVVMQSPFLLCSYMAMWLHSYKVVLSTAMQLLGFAVMWLCSYMAPSMTM